MNHKFKCQQLVQMNRMRFPTSKAASDLVYEVVRLMPPDVTGEYSYRIRAGLVERAVLESEIRQNVTT